MNLCYLSFLQNGVLGEGEITRKKIFVTFFKDIFKNLKKNPKNLEKSLKNLKNLQKNLTRFIFES